MFEDPKQVKRKPVRKKQLAKIRNETKVLGWCPVSQLYGYYVNLRQKSYIVWSGLYEDGC